VPTRFFELDLKQPAPSIFVDPRYERLTVLVRWGYLPLGSVEIDISAGSRTLLGPDLLNRVLRSQGGKLWSEMLTGEVNVLDPRDESRFPPVSVVVCSRDRAQYLEGCLKSLQRIDYPAYEVVVVDNGSKDPAVARVIQESGFRYVREDRPGLDWARNRGIAEAKCDLVAFTDDDARVDPGWLRGIASAFADPQVMAVTGLVLPAEIETPSQQQFEVYGGMGKGYARKIFRLQELQGPNLFWASSWGVGANMAFRREIFDKIGTFDVALDVGTPSGGGGDIEFFYRVVSSGYTLCYEPMAIVRHKHRRDPASLRRQIYSNGRSFLAYLLTIARRDPGRRFQILRFGVRNWAGEWLLKQLVKGLWTRNWFNFNLALIELWGAFSGPFAYWRSQRAARQCSSHLSPGLHPEIIESLE
jgi:glycosyltransferase involved in cell wall biosynthesis